MKFKNLIKKRRWRYPIYVLGFLLVAGTVANFLPWTRGWFHDLKWASGHLIKMRQQGFTTEKDYMGRKGFTGTSLSAYLHSLSIDENSPEGVELKRKFDSWYSQTLERYPDFRVEYKDVPDEQNGFLKILQWQDEIRSGKNISNNNFQLPPKFQSAVKKEQNSEFPVNIYKVETYLESRRDLLDRAMSIGLLPGQSISGNSPENAARLDEELAKTSTDISFFKGITDHLKLKAILEAKQGKADAALQTMKALRGWGNHYADVETPTLISSTLRSAIQLGMRNAIYWKILPSLPNDDIDYARWAELMTYEDDIQQRWLHMWRGNWHYSIHKVSVMSPSDPIALLSAMTADWYYLAGPEGINGTGEFTGKDPSSLNRLSIGDRGVYKITSMGIATYRMGHIRSEALLKQYELAFTLHRLEAEGQDSDALDQKILETLQLQILPDLKLSIDFDKRLVSVSDPTKKTAKIKPLEF